MRFRIRKETQVDTLQATYMEPYYEGCPIRGEAARKAWRKILEKMKKLDERKREA